MSYATVVGLFSRPSQVIINFFPTVLGETTIALDQHFHLYFLQHSLDNFSFHCVYFSFQFLIVNFSFEFLCLFQSSVSGCQFLLTLFTIQIFVKAIRETIT